jgi:hypothetical protein
MTGRELRPGAQQNVTDPFGSDEITRRETMEASENAGRPGPGRGSPALHRIDSDRAAETLSSGGNPAGFAGLNLMVSTIFDRLVAEPGAQRR